MKGSIQINPTDHLASHASLGLGLSTGEARLVTTPQLGTLCLSCTRAWFAVCISSSPCGATACWFILAEVQEPL
jgi:hypothetical protein